MSHRPLSVRHLALPVAVSSALAASHIQAQMLEEVVVTATKREQSVMDVPLAITALSGQFVMDTNLNDVKDLIAYTPGVSGNSQDSYIDAVAVRGVRYQDFGVGGDPSTGFFKNDLYEGRNGSAVTSLYDIDRVEILRGPQGFLFGRNAIAGAFSVYTAKADPDGQSGYIQLDIGERGHAVGEGAINIPLGDNLATRIAGYYSQEDGFSRNVFSGRDEIEHEKWALRWSTKYETDRLTVDGVVEYEERRQSGSMYRAIDTGDIWDTFDEYITDDTSLGGSNKELDSDIGFGEQDDADILTLGLFINYDLGFATLTSNTGYKDHDYFYKEDYDGTPLNINNFQFNQSGEYFQQEFRLTSNDDGPLGWYVGGSYYQEDLDAGFVAIGSEDLMCQYYLNPYASYYGYDFYNTCSDYYYDFYPSSDGTLTETSQIKGKYTGWAAYVNTDFDITENWNVEFGVRYTEDEKDFAILVPEPESYLGPYFTYGFATAEFIEDSDSWDDLTLRVGTTYTMGEALFFASYTQGFKSGGYGSFWIEDANGGVPASETGIRQGDGYLPGKFNPETVDSYEIGMKTSYLDGRGNFDITFLTTRTCRSLTTWRSRRPARLQAECSTSAKPKATVSRQQRQLPLATTSRCICLQAISTPRRPASRTSAAWKMSTAVRAVRYSGRPRSPRQGDLMPTSRWVMGPSPAPLNSPTKMSAAVVGKPTLKGILMPTPWRTCGSAMKPTGGMSVLMRKTSLMSSPGMATTPTAVLSRHTSSDPCGHVPLVSCWG